MSPAPEVMLGSVNAVTGTGSLAPASSGGSLLGPYASGDGRVILVVGTPKIVPDLEEGLPRIYTMLCWTNHVHVQAGLDDDGSECSRASSLAAPLRDPGTGEDGVWLPSL